MWDRLSSRSQVFVGRANSRDSTYQNSIRLISLHPHIPFSDTPFFLLRRQLAEQAAGLVQLGIIRIEDFLLNREG